jgi:hypothetical protein
MDRAHTLVRATVDLSRSPESINLWIGDNRVVDHQEIRCRPTETDVHRQSWIDRPLCACPGDCAGVGIGGFASRVPEGQGVPVCRQEPVAVAGGRGHETNDRTRRAS